MLKNIRLVLAIVAIFLAVPSQYAQTNIQINNPRPMAEAALEIERMFSLAINYEDCSYVHSEDISDVTDREVKAETRLAYPKFRLLVPRATSLSLRLSEAQSKSLLESATAAIGSYNSASRSTQFRLLEDQQSFTLLPSTCRSSDGSVKAFASPLEILVTLPAGPKNAGQLLNLVLQQLSKTSTYTVNLGQLPLTSFLNNSIMVSPGTHTGRSAIGQIIRATLGASIVRDSKETLNGSYHLYFDPGLKVFMLNVHALPSAELHPPTSPKPAEPQKNKLFTKQ